MFTSLVNGIDNEDELKLQLKEQVEESNKLLKKQKEQVITRYQDEFFAKNQQKQMNAQENTMNDLLKTVNELKSEIKSLKKNPSKNWSFVVLAVRWFMIKNHVLRVVQNKDESMRNQCKIRLCKFNNHTWFFCYCFSLFLFYTKYHCILNKTFQ
jgi:hypothetical protein